MVNRIKNIIIVLICVLIITFDPLRRCFEAIIETMRKHVDFNKDI